MSDDFTTETVYVYRSPGSPDGFGVTEVDAMKDHQSRRLSELVLFCWSLDIKDQETLDRVVAELGWQDHFGGYSDFAFKHRASHREKLIEFLRKKGISL